MKPPQTMIDRACNAYWAEAGKFVSTEERIRAALEAALSECPVVKVRGRVGEPAMINVSHSMVGKRVALVVLDD